MKAEMTDKLEEFLKNNYTNLTDEEVEEIATKIQVFLPDKHIKLNELEVGKIFTYKGYKFTKLADESSSCYCLLNDSAFESKFGETNDWAKSPIRVRLNEFDGKGCSKALPNINENDLVDVSLNYYAYQIPNGRTKDKITILSYEEYVAYDFAPIAKPNWLRSGRSDYADSARYLDSSGNYYGNSAAYSCAVRPALHLESDIEVEE